MRSKFLEKPNSTLYKLVDFLGHSNIFIALCAASLTAWSQKYFLHKLSAPFIILTFSATVIQYNLQRMYLSFFAHKPYSLSRWNYKNKYLLILLMIVCVAGLYPLLHISKQNALVFFISFLLGIFYFLPFSNLRTIPVVKSFTVGAVWVLICVVAPLEEVAWTTPKIFFCIIQLFFISALCVLFNIRDVERDRETNTHSVPVLFGIQKAKIFNYAILLFYLSLAPYVEISMKFFVICFITFMISCLLTQKSFPENHPFYYTFGVDGVIIIQSLLGFLLI
ncbi:MAG: UbiA family prenyltransferase [Bacteroidia bacterium]